MQDRIPVETLDLGFRWGGSTLLPVSEDIREIVGSKWKVMLLIGVE